MLQWGRRSLLQGRRPASARDALALAFSGAFLYAVEPSQRTVFCDAECLHSGKPAEYCAGPWYCSTTRVCETYNHRHQGKIVHHEWPKCARIKSCAHYEQCFPTEEQFRDMGFHEGTNAEFQEVPVPNHTELAKGNGVPLSSPFRYNVMGFRVRRPLLSLFVRTPRRRRSRRRAAKTRTTTGATSTYPATRRTTSST